MKTLIAAALSLFTCASHSAPTLAVHPGLATVTVGDPVTLDVLVSGFEGPLAIGTFDIVVSFDANVLALQATNFGGQLDLFGQGSIQLVEPSHGQVRVFELSLDSQADLEALQADAFPLFGVTFQALAPASPATVNFSLLALGSASGSGITPDFSSAVGNVTIMAVPEPASAGLLFSGMALLAAMRRGVRRDARVGT